MSTILKALRRLEEDKRAEEIVDLEERVVQATSTRSRSIGLVAVVASGVVVVVGLLALGSSFFGSSPGAKPGDTLPAALVAAPALDRPSADSALKRPAAQVPLELARIAAPEARAGATDAPALESEALAAKVGEQEIASSAPDEVPVVLAAREAPEVRGVPVDTREAPPVSAPVVRERAATLVVERPAGPAFVVTQTVWHPSPSRRVAVVSLAGRDSPLRVGEGDVVDGFTVLKIGLASVGLVRDGVSFERRVGAR